MQNLSHVHIVEYCLNKTGVVTIGISLVIRMVPDLQLRQDIVTIVLNTLFGLMEKCIIQRQEMLLFQILKCQDP